MMTDLPAATNIQQQPPENNGLGTASFVISLVGLVSCGLLCPIGFILGLFALGKEPKGMAKAGIAIGLVGTILPVLIFLLFGTAILAMCGLSAAGIAQMAERQSASRPAAEAIYTHYESAGSLPDDTTGEQIVSAFQHDGQAFRYDAGSTSENFLILHPGKDGQWNTSDDWSVDWDVFELDDESRAEPDNDDDTLKPDETETEPGTP